MDGENIVIGFQGIEVIFEANRPIN